MAKNRYHEHLQQVPLFAGLSKKELDAVGHTATEINYGPGEVLMTEGQRPHEMFVIISGEVGVTQGGEHVADVGPGGFVGEMALLAHTTRNSTVTTKTPSVVLHIDGREFASLLDMAPGIAVKMLPVIAGRVVSNSDHHSN